jgi:hypothetical protein
VKIISTYFEVNSSGIYSRLKNVFEYSIAKNSPRAELQMVEVPKFELDGKRFQAQMVKQREWTRYALEQKDEFIMMDCDMLVLRELTSAFNTEFDIGYTVHDQTIKPFNGGMIFSRSTEKARKFWQGWLCLCERMYINPGLRAQYNDKYKGFAQVALGILLETKPDCNIKKFPCSEWNVCDEEWENMAEEARCVHIKGRMRKALFKGTQIYSQKVYDLWRQYEQEHYRSGQERGRKNGGAL